MADMGFARLLKVFLKGLQNLSVMVNIAEVHGIDIVIKSMESDEKV